MTKTTKATLSGGVDRPSEQRGWTVLTCFIVFTGLLLAAHGGRIVTFAFTPLALLVGIYLLFRYERIYLVHVLLVLCCTPFVRRVADFGGPIVTFNPILGAPILVPFISLLRVKKLSVLDAKNMVFILPVLAILYGTLIGILHGGLRSVVIPIIAWSGPLAVGLFCYLHEDAEGTLAKTFNGAMVVIGTVVALYGILQYFAPPAWDTDWLAQMQANGQAMSMGSPEAYGIRVFATCSNAQGAGSLFGFSLLIACLYRSRWKLFTVTAIIFALALTSVRSAWLACALGGLVLLSRVKPKAKITAIAFACVLIAVSSALATTSTGNNVLQRVFSLRSVKTDSSYRERQLGRAEALKVIRQEPFGLGIGYETSDAKRMHFAGTDLGITTMLIELGYLGATLYGIAIVMLLLGPLWRGLRGESNVLSLAIGMLFMTFLFANTDPLSNALGILFWVPAGLLLRHIPIEPRVTESSVSTTQRQPQFQRTSEAVLNRLA